MASAPSNQPPPFLPLPTTRTAPAGGPAPSQHPAGETSFSTASHLNETATTHPPLNAALAKNPGGLPSGTIVSAHHTAATNHDDLSQLEAYKNVAENARNQLVAKGKESLEKKSLSKSNFGQVPVGATSGGPQVVTGVRAGQVHTGNSDLDKRLRDFEEEVKNLATGQTNLTPEEKSEKLKTALSNAQMLHNIGKDNINDQAVRTNYSKVTAGLINVIQREVLLVEASNVMKGQGKQTPDATRTASLRLIGELEKSEEGVKTPGVSQDKRAQETLAQLRKLETNKLIQKHSGAITDAQRSAGPHASVSYQRAMNATASAMTAYSNRVAELAGESPEQKQLVGELKNLTAVWTDNLFKDLNRYDHKDLDGLTSLKGVINDITKQHEMLGKALDAANINKNDDPDYKALGKLLGEAQTKYNNNLQSGLGKTSLHKLEEQTNKEIRAQSDKIDSANDPAEIMDAVRYLAGNVMNGYVPVIKDKRAATASKGRNLETSTSGDVMRTIHQGILKLSPDNQNKIFDQFPELKPKTANIGAEPARPHTLGEIEAIINQEIRDAGGLKKAHDNDLSTWIKMLTEGIDAKKEADAGAYTTLEENRLRELTAEWNGRNEADRK